MTRPPVWVLPGTLSGAGQGRPGICLQIRGDFSICYVTFYWSAAEGYTPFRGYRPDRIHTKNAKCLIIKKRKQDCHFNGNPAFHIICGYAVLLSDGTLFLARRAAAVHVLLELPGQQFGNFSCGLFFLLRAPPLIHWQILIDWCGWQETPIWCP